MAVPIPDLNLNLSSTSSSGVGGGDVFAFGGGDMGTVLDKAMLLGGPDGMQAQQAAKTSIMTYAPWGVAALAVGFALVKGFK